MCLHRKKILTKSEEYKPTGTYTDVIHDEGIKAGVYGVVGPQGVGKTSFCMALLSLDAKWHSEERLAKARAEIAEYNKQNPTDEPVRCPECMYRTRSKLWLPNNKPTYHTDIWQFGLPSPEFPDIQYFPRSTVIFCDEIDGYLDCRRYNEDTNRKKQIYDGLKYVRHQDIALLWDAQVFDNVDAKVRRLTMNLIYILGKRDTYGYPPEPPHRKHHWLRRKHARQQQRQKILLRTEWEFVMIPQQQSDNSEILKEMGVDMSKYVNAPERLKLIYEGNIYKQYNSYSGKPLWYRGLRQFSIDKHPESAFSKEGIEQFCRQNRMRIEKCEQIELPPDGIKNPE